MLLTKKKSPHRVCGWRRLRQILAEGEDVFWARDRVGRLWIKGPARVAQALGARDRPLFAFWIQTGIKERPVFFGEDGAPTLKYEIDARHNEWRCGLEIEAGQAVMGNAVYRDLIQALVIVQVDVLILAVPNEYKYRSSGRPTSSHDYVKTLSVVETLYSHARFQFPYSLVLIGY
jgi:hypothetical protein